MIDGVVKVSTKLRPLNQQLFKKSPVIACFDGLDVCILVAEERVEHLRPHVQRQAMRNPIYIYIYIYI